MHLKHLSALYDTRLFWLVMFVVGLQTTAAYGGWLDEEKKKIEEVSPSGKAVKDALNRSSAQTPTTLPKPSSEQHAALPVTHDGAPQSAAGIVTGVLIPGVGASLLDPRITGDNRESRFAVGVRLAN